MGLEKGNNEKNDMVGNFTNELYRADIIDRDLTLSKTVNSIDIGISPLKIIDEKRLLLNLKYIFPNKDYDSVKKLKEKFFLF